METGQGLGQLGVESQESQKNQDKRRLLFHPPGKKEWIADSGSGAGGGCLVTAKKLATFLKLRRC